MSRTFIPLAIGDISAFARSLHSQLSASEGLPGHLALLNMLARAAGYRNFQSLRALNAGSVPAVAAEPAQEAVNLLAVRRAARYFDSQGRLATWPAKAGVQTLCLWGIWSQLPAASSWTEGELNNLLRGWHLFGDHAILRRSLCDQEFVSRSTDGRQYRRIERRPTTEALALIAAVTRRGQ